MNAPSQPPLGITLLDYLWLLALVIAVGSLDAWDRWQASQPVAAAAATGLAAAPAGQPAQRPDNAAPEATPPASGQVGDQGRQQAPGGTARPDSPAAANGSAPRDTSQEKERAPANPAAGKDAASGEPAADPKPKVLPQAREDDGKPKLAVAAGILPPPNPLDEVVERFILYDIGQLPGPEGKEARSAFGRLGTESVPALIRGLNRAASLTSSSPVVVLGEKLQGVLSLCGPELTELAVGQLGIGVPATKPHYYRLESLKERLLTSLLADHPLRRRIELAKRLSAKPAEIPEHVRSDDPNDRWAAARAILLCGAPLGGELTQLVGDVEPVIIQEARAALVRLAGDKDFGPEPHADLAERERALADWRSWWFSRSNNAVFRRMSKMTDKELRAALQSQDAEERWAAVVLVGNRRLPCSAELIGLLRDSDLAVRRDARRTLIQFAEGMDFGPTEDAAPQMVDEAVAKWQQWRRLQELIQAFAARSPDELIAALARADPVERLAAVRVARDRKLDRPEEFIQLLSDPQPEIAQEARHLLVQISGGADFGPSENAGREAVQDAVARWQRWLRWHRLVLAFESQDEAELLAAFQSEEPLERWAAVSAGRRKGLGAGAQLIPLLRDSSLEVQQEARQALVELAGGEYDLGPPEQGDPPAVERAVTRWTAWWKREELLVRLQDIPVPDLAASLRSSDLATRWAAAAAARRRGAPLHEELVQLMRDPEEDVRREAHRALLQLTGRPDFGLAEADGPQAIDEAASQWQKWWTEEAERREASADNALKLATIVVDKNPTAGRRRLQEIVSQFVGTRAAQTAQHLLDTVPEVAPRQDQAPERSSSAAARGAETRQNPSAKPAEKVAPEQLEKEAAVMLRLARMTLSHRPEMFRERLRELIEQYPGTKAAQEVQRLWDAESVKPPTTGETRKKSEWRVRRPPASENPRTTPTAR